MKNLFSILLLLFIAVSCNTSKKVSKTSEKTDSLRKNDVTEKTTKTFDSSTVAAITDSFVEKNKTVSQKTIIEDFDVVDLDSGSVVKANDYFPVVTASNGKVKLFLPKKKSVENTNAATDKASKTKTDLTKRNVITEDATKTDNTVTKTVTNVKNVDKKVSRSSVLFWFVVLLVVSVSLYLANRKYKFIV